MSLVAPLPLAAPADAASTRALRLWLLLLAGLVLAMVVVGGATRLTGSGLSIPEWRPVTGALPPLSQAAWLDAFAQYRATPQYDLLNQGMTLGAFQEIYWWEWSHRQLGRAIGLVFAGGVAYFLWTGALRGRLAAAVFGIGLLGALQGAIGWIMVASGLRPGMTAVAPVKLMLHLVTASVIFAALLWLAAGPSGAPRVRLSLWARRGALALLGLTLLQIALGALVAGSKAGLAYNSWPLMDRRLAPPLDELFAIRPWAENFVDNIALVQLNHRLAAYLLVGAALWHAFAVRRQAPRSGPAMRAAVLAGLAFGQMTIGVATLLLFVPLELALLHQGFAMIVLGTAAIHARWCQGV